MDDPKIHAVARLAEFNRLLAEVHEIVADAEFEDGLLQDVCDAVAAQRPLGLVWCAIPDAEGWLEIKAAAGRTAYLNGIEISVDSARREGQGYSGLAWRDGQTRYAAFLTEDPVMQPWYERAARVGLSGVVVVRLNRHRSPWGLISFYLTDGQDFEPGIRLLLEEIARTITRGLDRLDGRHRELELFRAQSILLDHAGAGIALCQSGSVIVANPHLAGLLGYEMPQALKGMPISGFCERDEDRRVVEHLLGRLTKEGQGTVAGVHLTRLDSRPPVVADMTMSLSQYDGGATVVWTVVDVTERARLETVLASQARTDAVTGLANRWEFESELAQRLARAEETGTALAVCFLDLDNFKQVNDTWGHDIGDAVLREMGRRLRTQLDDTVFVGRTGGDEFVLIQDGFPPEHVVEHLDWLVGNLRPLIESPWDAIPMGRVMDLSMGIAVYPEDSTNVVELMRAADQALYRVKRHKHDRIRWWLRAGEDSVDSEADTHEPTDPWDSRAATQLQSVQSLVVQAANQWIKKFDTILGDNPLDSKTLSSFPDSLRETLRVQRVALATAALDPGATPNAIQDRAYALGQTLTLVGMPLSWRTRSVLSYQEALTEELDGHWMTTRDRYRVQRVVEQRLQTVLDGLLKAGEETLRDYVEFLSQPLPERLGGWVETAQMEVERLVDLPGIRAAFVVRPGPGGEAMIECNAGVDAVLSAMRIRDHAAYEDILNHLATSAADFRVPDLHACPWRDATSDFPSRSLLALPLRDRDTQFIAGLYMLGEHPYQFESPVMRQFAQGLQSRWEQLWRRASSPGEPVPKETAYDYRDRLFHGGLEMYMQPVVELETGQVVSVEALARLNLSDGRQVPPGAFLPVLGTEDLARLFRMGLDQALEHREAFAEGGHDVRVAVNLPPCCLTLPDLPGWVADALARHQTDPSRLSLELLETQDVDVAVRDAVVAQLVGLGVYLALDDLGSGYSSLMRLASLPLRTVKIDQGLVRSIHHDAIRTFAVIDALRGLCERLQRDIVVEGLETADMVEAVYVLGVPFGQGYGLARPMPASDFMPWAVSFTRCYDADDTLTSFLGAAAYDWKYGHVGGLEECPLTRFLRSHAGSEPISWHHTLHGGYDEGRDHQRFQEWLISEVASHAPFPS